MVIKIELERHLVPIQSGKIAVPLYIYGFDGETTFDQKYLAHEYPMLLAASRRTVAGILIKSENFNKHLQYDLNFEVKTETDNFHLIIFFPDSPAKKSRARLETFTLEKVILAFD